jgi:hypothetical protein
MAVSNFSGTGWSWVERHCGPSRRAQGFSESPTPQKCGDKLKMLLIQVKGGTSADPQDDDLIRIRKVADLYGASEILLAHWKKGSAARFFRVRPERTTGVPNWSLVDDIAAVFR